MKKRTVCFITVLTTLITLLSGWCIYWFLKEKAFEKELEQEEDLYDDFSDVHVDLESNYNVDNIDTEFDLEDEDTTETLTTL